jgi:hypothetical protein
MQQFGGWFTNTKPAWEENFEKLSYYDLKKLNMDKEKIHNILSQLYEWGVIR